MGLLLDCAYTAALGVASPYLIYKAVTRPRHVRGLRARLGVDLPPASERPCIWVHGVSVGEVLAAESFVATLAESFPEYDIALSTSTSTGQEVARKTYASRRVFYFPVDFSWSVSRIIDRIQPALVVLVELELWPNFLQQTRARGIPVAVVNGRISERSARRYAVAPGVVRAMFGAVDRYGAQTEAYAERFRALGVPAERVTVTGSMKYDNLRAPEAIDAKAIRARLGLAPDAPVLLGGSTHAGEESALLAAYTALRPSHPGLRLVLVPRHNERAPEVAREVEGAGARCLRFSELQAGAATDGAPVILVDVMGELGRLYAAADLCFVGGSLIPHGGQNILEPACLGKAVLFGPHTFNFTESVSGLLEHQAALQVEDGAELTRRLAELLDDPEGARALGERARETLERKRGATRQTIAILSELLVGDREALPKAR